MSQKDGGVGKLVTTDTIEGKQMLHPEKRQIGG